MNLSKSRWLAAALSLILLGSWVGWVEIRTRNQSRLIDLAFDGGSCSQLGRSREAVRACFRALHYSVVPFGKSDDVVSPQLIFQAARYGFLIQYDRSGKVARTGLYSMHELF